MKKTLLVGSLLLISACQSAPSELSPIPENTATRFSPTAKLATVTPPTIPSATPTLTPLPPKRYFTEEFDTTLNYWSILYTSGDSSRVDILNEEKTLTFELHKPNTWLYAIYGAFDYESVHLETRVENYGSEVNGLGLVCHYDELEGWYEFNIANDGTYNVLHGQWLVDEIAHYTPILNDTSDRIETGKSINEIGLDCYENIVQLYINGKLIRKLDVQHIGLTDGKVGFSIASFDETPVILSFDWVKVGQLETP